VPHLRFLLRTEFAAGTHPQILMRIGRAAPGPPSARRPLDEILTDERAGPA
jgi:hypothetical protein